jgi:hypothetical protein
MEQVGRRNSGVHSIASNGSATGLRGDEALPAGSRFSEGNVANDPAGSATPPPVPSKPKKPFYKRRKFIIAQLIIIPIGIALLFILLFPVVKAIAQMLVNKSTLDVQAAKITEPKADSFSLALSGNVAHTGKINARIQFTRPVNVSWQESEDKETPIGYMQLHDINSRSSRADIDDQTTFFITDQAAFGRFTEVMITSQNFTWNLASDNLHVHALKFPVAKGIKFRKSLTLNGFHSFNGHVILQDFQLPRDNPAGGIDFIAVNQLDNASPFVIDLGTVVFDLSYKGVYLGSGTGINTSVAPGNNTISLAGTLIPQSGDQNISVVSELFTHYLNGESSPVMAVGKSTIQADNSSVPWLSQGLQALTLEVPFKSPVDITPIKSVSIGDFDLSFNSSGAWAPVANSRTVQAQLHLPFGFGLSIDQIQNDFNITQNGKSVAALNTPLGASTSNVTVNGEKDTSGTIDISIVNTPLMVPGDAHDLFSAFNANLTSQDELKFRLTGNSKTIARMSIGNITLDPIKVDVETSLKGLKGLKDLVTINSVDVTGGKKEGIQLDIGVVINNPSNLKLETGDLTLQLLRDSAVLGTSLLPNLTLNMGSNNLTSSSIFDSNTDQGSRTLDEFVGGKDVALDIAGFDGSTEVASLLKAFKSLNIPVTLPALKTRLLDSAALTVLPTTGRENNISHVIVNLNNPWSAPLRITKITSTVKYQSLTVGTISSDEAFTSDPKKQTASPQLNLDMNFDHPTLFTLTRALAVEAGLDVAPLDGIVELGGYQYLFTTGDKPSKVKRDNLYTGFNLPNFVQTAFKKLTSDVELVAEVTIGDFTTTLHYTQPGLPTKTDDTLNLILPILAQPIVQKIVDGSVLGIDTVLISDPKQESFNTGLNGSITNAGPFDAVIKFPEGLTVAWSDQPLGSLKMGDVDVVGDKGAAISLTSAFKVADVGHLTEFTKTLLTKESFDWKITGENLTVSALGIDVGEVALSDKAVTLKGFNGLKDAVKIQTFDLPKNDPDGGIHLTIESTVKNPSQVGMSVSSLGFNTMVDGTLIAVVAATDVKLNPLSDSSLPLVGRMVPQDNDKGLSVVSGVFNRFIHGQDSDVIVQGASAGSSDVKWLNDGIKALNTGTALPNRGKLDLIKTINLNQMELLFTQDTAYNPASGSNSTDAAFTLPFAFPVDITSLEQTITVGFEGTDFAQLALPKANTKTDVDARIIHLTFDQVPFAVFSGQHSVFNKFVASTTVGGKQTLRLSGSANGDAKTAVGVLGLKDIAFDVESSIDGLEGLDKEPVTISGLDVNHGYPDYLLIKVQSLINNPSNLTIGSGDVVFDLRFTDASIGTANLNNLLIVPGTRNYSTDVHYAPHGDAVSAGQKMLANYIQGVDSDTTIAGTSHSTPIESLQDGLSQLKFSPVTIPALHQSIVTAASLSFPKDIVQKGVAQSTFTLDNPFTASINLLSVGSDVTYHGIKIGRINNVDLSSNPVHADGHSKATSQKLPLDFNLDPLSIINLLLTASKERNVDLGPLPGLFQVVIDNPDFHPPVTTSVDDNKPTCNSGKQFDVNSAILKTLNGIEVDLDIESKTKLDDFATDLSFKQTSVPSSVDETALYLIGAVAAPITQSLVDNADLKFTEANITNISDEGFDLSLKGSLTNVGPLDAEITFVDPVKVTWQGHDIAEIVLPPVCAAANSGVPNYETKARLSITDHDQFTEFAVFLLHNPSFDWTISTPTLRVTALGTIFDKVSLSKKVSFKAFNGLPGVTISNFKLPSDDSAGGIHIETDADIPSPAQLGIDLGTVTFNSFYEDTLVGPLTASHLFLASSSLTKSHLSGRILPQSGDDLNTIGKLFSGYLQGKNATLITKGDSVQPDGSKNPVNWLSTAFKTLALEVILPGQKFDVIQSIAISDMSVTMQNQDQAFAPPSSSNHTLAVYKNPFGFSLQVVESGQDITIASHGVDIANLKLPKNPAQGEVSTGNNADLQLSWKDEPLKSINNQAFAALFAAITLQSSIDLTLKGTADVVAKTAIGQVPIDGIAFNVPSNIKGISNFGGKAVLNQTSVVGSGGNGGDEYIRGLLESKLDNPSNISLFTVDTALPVVYKDVMIGRAAIDPFNLVPGENALATEFRYEPNDKNDTVAQEFLAEFIQSSNDIPLTIKGDQASTPFDSLKQAFSGVHLSTGAPGLGVPKIITKINSVIPLTALVDNFIRIDFDVFNPLDTTMILEYAQSDAGVDGEVYAHFSQPVTIVVPPGQTVNSGNIDNVFLTQGAVAALGIVGRNLDISTGSTVRLGEGGYVAPWLQINEKDVETTYSIVPVLDSPLKLSLPQAKSMIAASSASSARAEASSASSASAATASTTQSSAQLSETPKPEPEGTMATSTQDEAPRTSGSAPTGQPDSSPSPSPSADSRPTGKPADNEKPNSTVEPAGNEKSIPTGKPADDEKPNASASSSAAS